MNGSSADVFLSYKAEDRPRLQPLITALEAEGISVWWDADIGGGVDWRQDIQEHLDAAKCVIVAWSKRSVGQEGRFVRDEASRAQRRGTYLPVRLDAVAPPLGFGEIQALPLQGWKGDRSDPRYQAVIQAVRSRLAGEEIAHGHVHQVKSPVSRRAALAGGAGAVAVAAAGGWLLLKPEGANAKRIAVLPFANLSNDPEQAYFSEGIAEELRAALSRIGLEVIGRTSSDAVKDLDAKTAADRLKVANILTGSVRRSPEIVRVNAQLVSGLDGVERWGQTYDRAPGDAIKIQSDIAASVARALSITLGQAGRAALALGGTADSIAQDLILQGRKLRDEGENADAFKRVIALVGEALARDSNYADAFALKASALNVLATNYPSGPADTDRGLAEAEVAAQRALAIAPKLGSAYSTLAEIKQGRLELANTSRFVRQALALSPEDPNVLAAACRIFAYIGQGAEAVRLADRFIAVDPLNSLSHRRKSEVWFFQRQYRQSIELGRKALEIAPNSQVARWWIGQSLMLLGEPAQARAEFEKISEGDPFRSTGFAILAARAGDAAAAKQNIARLWELLRESASYQYGEIYAQLGDKDRAFAELDNALKAKDPGLVYTKVDPLLDPIRNDPRYAALVERLNFP